MTKNFARPLFAAFVMILVAAALILATLSWVESRPARVHFATETTEMTKQTMVSLESTESPAVKLAATGSTARNSTLTRP